MNVAELFIRCLEAEGVSYVFGVPGEENEELLFALEDSPIQFVPTRHEQGAAFMANVWGRITGRAGVCLSTLGPGATNLITGVADGNLDKAPLVAITGQGSTTRLHHESHQYIDIVNMFRPITKWNTSVSSAETVPEIVRKLFKLAESEKPGATHVELAEDVAGETAGDDLQPLERTDPRRSGPDYKATNQTLKLLASVRRPLVLAGNGAIRKLASKHLTELATTYGIPVVSTFMGKGAVSDRLDQSLFSIGLGFRDYVMEAIDKSDLIISVGYDIAEYPPEAWNTKGDKRIVHVDFVPAEVYAHYVPDVEIVADISATLWELNRQLQEVATQFDQDWYRSIRRRIKDDAASYKLGDGDAFTTPGVLNLVRQALPDDGLLISDVGAHKMWIARNFPTFCPNGCLISNGLASMGIALPGAIAAALAQSDRPIVSAMGDGGFLMNAQELETAKRLDVGFTCIVFNDNDYGLISWKQELSRGRSVSTRIGNPDFKALAESFGLKAHRPSSVDELRGVLEESIASGEMRLIEIPVNTTVNHELVERLETYWKAHE